MMEAIHISLNEEDIDQERTTSHLGGWDLYADSEEFTKAVRRRGFDSPSGHAGITESRFRLCLNVPGQPRLCGVYYVSGWLDEGLVHLECDDDQSHVVPRRREAILATRRRNLS